MNQIRNPIAFICALARYFWLYEPLVTEMCVCPQTKVAVPPFKCMTSFSFYTQNWYVIYLLVYVSLCILDLHLFSPKACLTLKWICVLMLAHSQMSVSSWISIEVADAALLVFQNIYMTCKNFEPQKLKEIVQECKLSESSNKQEIPQVDPNKENYQIINKLVEAVVSQNVQNKPKRFIQYSTTPTKCDDNKSQFFNYIEEEPCN